MKKIIILILITIIVVISTIIIIINYNKKNDFVAIFENDVIDSNLPVNDVYKYSQLNIKEGYTVGINSVLIKDSDQNIKINLTAVDTNNVYIKAKIFDINNNLLYETNLLKPGQRLEYIRIDKIQDDIDVKIKIMSYNTDTYYSEGVVILNSKIKIGGSI